MINKNITRGLLTFTVLSLLYSCSDENPWSEESGEGGIIPSISTDVSVKDALPTRSSAYEIKAPESKNFALKLTKADGTVSKSWDSADLFPTDEGFRSGDYTLEAIYSSIDTEGLNKPCFKGSQDFTVRPGDVSEVAVTASLANTMVSMDFTDEFKAYFPSYSVVLHSEGYAYNELPSNADEPMFLAPGEVNIAISFTTTDGKSATIEPAKFNALARHHYHVTLNVNNGNVGTAALELKFDDSVVEDNVTIDLSEDLLNLPAPTVTPQSFTSGEVIYMLQGSALPAKFTIMASAGLSQAILTANSDSFSLGVGSNNEVDLMSLDANGQTIVKNKGINCIGLFKNPDKMASVDLSNVIPNLEVGTHSFTMVAKDVLTRINEPVTCSVVIEPVTLTYVSSQPSLYGTTTAVVRVAYNGEDLANKVSFKAQSGSGVWTDCSIAKVEEVSSATAIRGRKLKKATRSSDHFPDKYYDVTLNLPDRNSNIPVKAYYNGNEMISETIEKKMPEYDVAVDAYSRKAVLQVTSDDASLLSSVINNLRVWAGDSEIATSAITRNATAGTVTISGLTPSTTYAIQTSVQQGSTATKKSHGSITTEAGTALTNGDFSASTNTINMTDVQVGGQYKVSPVSYTIKSSIVRSEADGWASVNAKTCYTGSSNINTWFVVPSTWADNGQVVLRNVAYDHAGTTPSTSGGAFNTTYYCTNTPSSFAGYAAGELFLGSYSYDGSEHRTDGISFTSRPTSLSFDYSYVPTDSDNAVVVISVLDSSNNVIATKTATLSSQSSMTSTTVSLPAYAFGSKAAKLQLCFKSSNQSTPPVVVPTGSSLSEGQSLGNKTISANSYHAVATGSVLTLDNVTLNY